MPQKRRPGGDEPGGRRRPRPAPEALPDPRTLERHLHQFAGDHAEPGTPRGQAEGLLARAFQEASLPKRVELARHALTLWPDCADAFVLLAENTHSRKEALQLYQQGVTAGERAIGSETVEREAGHFWALLETRPYMRARLGLAHSLWTTGRRQEAVEHLQEMLRLNPNDNQGVRYTLAGFLLFLDRDADLTQLLGQYPDEASAAWAYTKALLAFRQHGDTPEARRLLEEAKETNRHVPDYLLDRRFPSPERPGSYRPGDEAEALNYIGSFLAGWKATPGAVAWLRANDEQTLKRKAQVPQPRGPLPLVKNWLKKKLPQQQGDVWQADCRQVDNPILLAGDRVRPWVAFVTSKTDNLVLAHAVLEEEPIPAVLWDTLVQAMQNPVVGEPHRPAELQVRADERWEALRPHVEEIGVRFVATEELDHLTTMFNDMSESIAGRPRPGLLDVPGVKPEQVAAFYEAAASFFRQAPWKQVGYEAAIRVACEKYHGGPWFAVLMGQSGLTTGLALYQDLGPLRGMREHPGDYRENARQSVATTVIFGEEIDLPLADVQAAREHDWTVARPDAWPLVMHKERGLSHRPPLAWELELLEGCLRAVPEFVRRRPQDDLGTEEMTVAVASGELNVVLSWVQEDQGK